VAEVLVGNDTPPVSKVAPPSPRDGRQRATFNLSNIGKVTKTSEEVPVVVQTERVPDKPVVEDQLRLAWEEFTVLRKNSVAEITLLKRDYVLQGNTIVIPLSNPIEEPLLLNMRTSMITFLRDKLGNSSLMVVGKLQEIAQAPNMPYTNKDRFEHLANKNPVLRDLKERFGLDPDLS
jgi:DNA polymerase-3 subunit gamma/tau